MSPASRLTGYKKTSFSWNRCPTCTLRSCQCLNETRFRINRELCVKRKRAKRKLSCFFLEPTWQLYDTLETTHFDKSSNSGEPWNRILCPCLFILWHLIVFPFMSLLHSLPGNDSRTEQLTSYPYVENCTSSFSFAHSSYAVQ